MQERLRTPLTQPGRRSMLTWRPIRKDSSSHMTHLRRISRNSMNGNSTLSSQVGEILIGLFYLCYYVVWCKINSGLFCIIFVHFHPPLKLPCTCSYITHILVHVLEWNRCFYSQSALKLEGKLDFEKYFSTRASSLLQGFLLFERSRW